MNTWKLITALLFTAGTALAQAPLLNYQGKLLDTNGVPFNGLVDVVINVHSQSVGGSPVYSESMGNVVVQDGLYSFNWGQAGTSPVARVEQMVVTDGTNDIYGYNVLLPPIANLSVEITEDSWSWSDTGGPSQFCGKLSAVTHGGSI